MHGAMQFRVIFSVVLFALHANGTGAKHHEWNSQTIFSQDHQKFAGKHTGIHRHGGRAVGVNSEKGYANVARSGEMDKLVLDTRTGVQYNPYSKHHPGRHVCTRYQERPVKSKQAYCRPTFKNYVVNCQGNQICKGVRLVYETHYKDVITTRSSNEVIHLCCPGWSQNNNRSHGCHKATCNKPCLNGGKCVKPEMCACLKGFSGQQCEIHFHTPPCHEGCKNGGICAQDGVCKCSKGFTGRYCEHDIDECKEEKPCDQICYNTHGSYSCQCREDFVLQNDGQSCRKESDGDGGSEAKDLEFELLDRRLLKLETMMDETHKNDVSKNDLDNVYKDMGSISENINSLKNKISDVENYKKDMYVFKNKLNKIEKKAEQVDELIIKYDRIKKCAFYNKICM